MSALTAIVHRKRSVNKQYKSTK